MTRLLICCQLAFGYGRFSAESISPGLDGSDTEAAWTTALAAHLGGEAEQEIDGVDVLTGTQAIELDWLKGNKFHEGIGQALLSLHPVSLNLEP